MKTLVITISILILFSSLSLSQNESLKNILWYDKPAANWNEALPIGNGRFGGMVFGASEEEHIQLNEDTFWSGGKYDPTNTEAFENLPKVRALLKEGKYDEALNLAETKMMGKPKYLQNYQPLGDLYIKLPNHDSVAEYRRELNLNDAVVKVEYANNGIKFTREYFSSYPDQLMVVRLAASKPGAISFMASLNSIQPHAVQKEGDSTLVLSGQWKGQLDRAEDHLRKYKDLAALWYGDGLKFDIILKTSIKNGKIRIENDTIYVDSSDEAFLSLSAAVNYKNESSYDAAKRYLQASPKNFEDIKARHLEDYHSLFNRANVSLGGEGYSLLPTNERLIRMQNGMDDPQLAAIYFQFGRYLLISSSRPGTQPATLQGIWNDSPYPTWGSKYTININTEMNYWHAEETNLAECHEPLFDLIESLREPGRNTARIHYGCGGFVAHHNTDLWRSTTPVDGAQWGLWPMGAAWLSTHLYEHYDYSRDKEFLRKVYPTMKEASQFLLDFLIEDESGYLVTSPSFSPENTFIDSLGNTGYLTVGATMDFEIIYSLFTKTIKACEILNTDKEFENKLKNVLSRIPPLKIGKHGQLQEWMVDYDEKEPGHRHISHLFGLYPGDQISLYKTPELAKAAKTSLERRLQYGGGHTGWSRAWIINLWARLEEPEKAYENVKLLLAKSTLPNMFDNHPPFQIDGNFGGAAGIAEMLLQSNNDELNILPALPKEWDNGYINGFRARGAFDVSMKWKNGLLQRLEIKSNMGEICNLRYKGKKLSLETIKGRTYILNDAFQLIEN